MSVQFRIGEFSASSAPVWVLDTSGYEFVIFRIGRLSNMKPPCRFYTVLAKYYNFRPLHRNPGFATPATGLLYSPNAPIGRPGCPWMEPVGALGR